MTTYVDSSALVAIYVPERFSKPARAIVRGARQVPFTALHHLEVRHAFELLVGRGLVSADEYEILVGQLDDDVEHQRLMTVPLDLDDVFRQAGELSRQHTARFLTRSLDLLHVAAAHAINCRVFVSADDRQLAAAKASGLTTVDIKRRVRLPKG